MKIHYKIQFNCVGGRHPGVVVGKFILLLAFPLQITVLKLYFLLIVAAGT